MVGNHQPNPQKPALSWSTPASLPVNGSKKEEKAPKQQPLPATTYGRKMLAVAFGIGLVVGVLLGWTWFASDGTAPVVEKEEKQAVISQEAASQNASNFELTSQKAGLTVGISDLEIGKPTWIAVHESRNGELGNVLGARLFFPVSGGGSTEGDVTLLRATMPGQTYFVAQYTDNGDKKFSTRNDTRVLAEGEALLLTFIAK